MWRSACSVSLCGALDRGRAAGGRGFAVRVFTPLFWQMFRFGEVREPKRGGGLRAAGAGDVLFGSQTPGAAVGRGERDAELCERAEMRKMCGNMR